MTSDQLHGRQLPRALAEVSESAAFRHALVGMAVLDPEFRILRVNRALARSLGYRVEEMEYLPPERFTHPADVAGLADHLARLSITAQPLAPYRKRCLKRDGGCLLCDLSFEPIGKVEDPAGWLCQIQDVTLREDAIESLERERRLFIGGPVVVFRWVNAPGWPVEYVSPNVLQEFGWASEDLLSGTIPYASLVHPEDLQRVAAEVAAHASSGAGTFEQTYRMRDAEGHWRWIREFTVIHPDADGVITHFEGYIFDDSSRISALRESAVREADLSRLLRFSRRTLRSNSLDQLVELVQTDLQDRLGVSHTLLFLFETTPPSRARLVAGAGEAHAEIRELGDALPLDSMPFLSAAARSDEPIFHPDVRGDPAVQVEYLQRLATRSLLVTPLFHAHEVLGALCAGTRAEERTLALNASDLEYFRALAGIVAVAFGRIRLELDGRQAQLRLRQVEKLEAVGQLAGGVAHNFNNALTVILGHASLLIETAAPGSALRSSLEAILRSGEGSAKAVSQLLQFARPLTERQLERIEPTTSLNEFSKMLRAVLDESVRLVVRTDPDLPAVELEGGAFTMILMNLVLNARDAMFGGGKLLIRAAREDRQGGRWLRLEIEDDGCGMDDSVQARIFEPFFTTKGERGTGLGLAAVYGAVTRAGGSIDVRSALGQGSRFTIRLPETARRGDDPTAVSRPLDGRGRRILVVEDEEIVRVFTSQALRAHGYQVSTAPQASAALELLSRNSFDLVVSDVVMHGMDGYALAREIARRLAAPAVLLMSGYPGGGSSPSLSAPVRGMLRKPFTVRQLTLAVEQALSGAAANPAELEPTAE